MNATPPPNSLQVVCAIITNSKNEILACQRNSMTSLPGKWEFPGGKIETNESKKSAIIREIKEELGVTIEVEREDSPVLYQYPSFHISLYPFAVCFSYAEPSYPYFIHFCHSLSFL